MIRILNGMLGATGLLIGVLPTAAFAQLEETAERRAGMHGRHHLAVQLRDPE